MSTRKSARIRESNSTFKSQLVEASSENNSLNSTPIMKERTEKNITPKLVPSRLNLRPRKETNYRPEQDSFADSLNGDDDNSADRDYGTKTDSESDVDSSDSELFSKKKRKLNNTKVNDQSFLQVFEKIDPTDEENDYRRLRQKNMQDRFKVLDSLEFDSEKQALKSVVKVTPKRNPVPKKRPPKPQQLPKEPTKRSLRLQNRSSSGSFDGTKNEPELQFGSFTTKDEDSEDEKFTDENVPFIDTDAEENMIEVLKALKNNINLPYEETIGFSSSDFDKYCEIVKSCSMRHEPFRIVPQRISAMDFHPSAKKLIVVAGDKSGNIGLRDIVNQDIGIDFRAHSRGVNCITFSTQDHTKFFSTSLQGTVRQGDINSSNSALVYKADNGEHTTWHHEFGHTLLVGEGDGVVKIVDLRAPGDESVSLKCHHRSVRTVQLHPTNENYFVTGSGHGEFGIFDFRTSKSTEPNPVVLQPFKKALTSAFISAKGTYVVSTCNDDTIRVFDVSDLKTSTQVVSFSHNNHTGRWLSVFKAKWHPGREDAFLVGSMKDNPKRLFQHNGILIHQFASEELMRTYSPVIVAHPSEPVFIGGNGSGKIHIFSPFESLEKIYS